MTNYQNTDLVLARVLYNAVTSKCYNMTYSACAEEMTRLLGEKVNAHGGLRMPLYHVGGLCHELNLPLITAIVRLKNAKTTVQIGEGFYTMACEFHPEYKKLEPVDAWKTELNRVKLCKDWNVLDEYLKKYDR